MMNMALESHERRLAANRSKPPGSLTRTLPPASSNGITAPSDAHPDHQPKRPHNSVVQSDSRVAPELLVANDPSFTPARSYQPINAPPPIGSPIPSFQPATPYGAASDNSYRPGGGSQPGTPLMPTYGQPNPFYTGSSSAAVQLPPPYTQDWLAWSQQFVPAISLGSSVGNPPPPPQQQQPPPGPPDYVKYNSASTLVQLRVGDPGAPVGVAHLPDVWPMSFLGYTPGAGS
jgi:hypothetical protein